MERALQKKDLARINEAFYRDDISKLINIKTIHLSPTDILVTAKVDIKDECEAQSPEIVNDIERTLRAAFPNYKIYIYIETDNYQEDYRQRTSYLLKHQLVDHKKAMAMRTIHIVSIAISSYLHIHSTER